MRACRIRRRIMRLRIMLACRIRRRIMRLRIMRAKPFPDRCCLHHLCPWPWRLHHKSRIKWIKHSRTMQPSMCFVSNTQQCSKMPMSSFQISKRTKVRTRIMQPCPFSRRLNTHSPRWNPMQCGLQSMCGRHSSHTSRNMLALSSGQSCKPLGNHRTRHRTQK